MTSWRYGCWLAALLLAGTIAAVRAADSPADKKAAPPDQPLMPPAGQKAGDWKLPSDAVIVFADQAADALGVTAKQVVLSYAKYKELLDEIARLKAKAKPAPPAKCRLLKGRVEGGVVLFTAQFEFHADRPDAAFALACGQAKALGAQQQPDGRTPLLSSDPDGFLVQVDKPGDYQVSLDLSLPLSQRPGGRGLELDLPRAVVTTLEMDLPADARSPRLAGKELTESSLTFKNGRLEGPLGPADKLDLSWQGAPPPGVGPLQTVRGRVKVSVQDGWVATEAELLLRTQGGPVGQWVLSAPPGAEVKAALPADQPRVKAVNRADEAGGARYTVVLNEPSDDDLTLIVTVRAPLTDGKRAPVGPFVVRGASRQSGAVLVSAPAQDARLVFHPQPELTPRDVTDEERRADPTLTAAYDYSTTLPNLPWLEVEAGSARGVIKTQVVYALAMVRTGPAGALEWQVTATLTASPLFQTSVDHLNIQLPADCEYLSSSLPDQVLSADWDKDSRVVHIKLADKLTGPVTVPVKARYVKPVVASVGQRVSLPLPWALDNPRDGGGRVDVTVPDEVELQAADVEPTVKEAHKLSWPFDKVPQDVVVSWQPYKPDAQASAVIDVTLHGPSAEAREELRLRFPRNAPDQITLRTPPVLGDSLQLTDGGQLLDEAAAPGTRVVRLAGQGQEYVLQLRYSFPTAERSFAVPLVTAEQAPDGETRVRVWSDSGQLPLPPDGAEDGWGAQNIEEVKGVDRLPVLVLRRLRPDAPLLLRLDDSAGTAATVMVDRVLYRAARADGVWDIRASYLLRQLAEPTLDVELPAGPAALGLRVALDGRQVDWQAVVESEQGGPVKHLARLRLATDLVRRPAVLDINYQLKPGQTEVVAARETLRPPLLVGDLRQAPTRWEVLLTPGDVALAPEDGAASRRTLAPRGWLLAPQLAVTGADLERWFAGPDAPARTEGAAVTPDLVCWQEAGDPLVLAYVPQWGWLLVCSLPLLLLGVFLFTMARQAHAGRPRAAVWFWLTVVLLIPALAAVWVCRPTVLYAIAYGCEPGAAVLLLALAFQWALLERYRRQIVFLPSFRRARTGSSLVRANGTHRAPGEPSTVDAPRPAGSSQQPA